MAEDAALVDIEDTRIGGVGGGVLDLFAQTALCAEAVKGELPGDVGLEMGGGAAGAEDEMFVSGAFGDKGPDFFLRREGIVLMREWVGKGRSAALGRDEHAYLGEDFLLLKLAQLGYCAFQVKAGFFGDVRHDDGAECARVGECGRW